MWDSVSFEDCVMKRGVVSMLDMFVKQYKNPQDYYSIGARCNDMVIWLTASKCCWFYTGQSSPPGLLWFSQTVLIHIPTYGHLDRRDYVS